MYVFLLYVYIYVCMGRAGVNIHTHFIVWSTNLENFSKENRMKLAAEMEFLPQEIWNEMRDRLLVDLMAIAITTGTLRFFPDLSFLMNVFWARKKHTVGVRWVQPWLCLLSGVKHWSQRHTQHRPLWAWQEWQRAEFSLAPITAAFAFFLAAKWSDGWGSTLIIWYTQTWESFDFPIETLYHSFLFPIVESGVVFSVAAKL